MLNHGKLNRGKLNHGKRVLDGVVGKLGFSVVLAAGLTACAGDPEEVRSDYAPLPTAANAMAATIFEGALYAHGGHIGPAHEQSRENTLSRFIRLDLDDAEAQWETLEPPGVGVQQSSLFVYNDDLYRLGGMTTLNEPEADADLWSLDVFERYVPSDDSWVSMPSMPDTRASHSLTVVDGVAYVMGGWTLTGIDGSNDYSETFMSIDLKEAEPQWQTRDLPFQLRDHCAAEVDNKVYVLGGMKSGVFPTEPWVYDPALDEWSRGAVVPATVLGLGGFGCGAAGINDTIYYSASDRLFSLNAARDAWDEVAELAAARFFHQLTARENEVVLVGGGVGMNVTPIDSVEQVSLR